MTSKGLRSLVVWRLWNQSTKPNAAATTARVNDPIKTKFARVSITNSETDQNELKNRNKNQKN
jgi:hypothetical protein